MDSNPALHFLNPSRFPLRHRACYDDAQKEESKIWFSKFKTKVKRNLLAYRVSRLQKMPRLCSEALNKLPPNHSKCKTGFSLKYSEGEIKRVKNKMAPQCEKCKRKLWKEKEKSLRFKRFMKAPSTFWI